MSFQRIIARPTFLAEVANKAFLLGALPAMEIPLFLIIKSLVTRRTKQFAQVLHDFVGIPSMLFFERAIAKIALVAISFLLSF